MERREPTLSSSSASISERDEPPARRSPPPERERPRREPEVQVVKSGGNGLAIFALLIALGAGGVAGYFGWQLMESQKQLSSADARITELENRLSITSDESSQSLTQVDAKLKWADSEIRKLWGVSNDINRKAIAGNTEKINGLTKDLAAVKKTASDAKTTAAGVQNQITASKASVDSAVAKIDSAVTGLAEQRKRLQDLTEQLDRTEAQLASLRTLEQKVRTNEEAIAAIDAYRRTLNRDLLQIKQQLGLVPAG